MMFRLKAVGTAMILGQVALACPAWAGDVASDAATDMSDIIVTGRLPPNDAFAATKTLTPLAETPQSISVISSEQINTLGLQNLDQALRFVAGVTPEQRGASADVYDLFTLRGFAAPVFLDGLYYVYQTDGTGYAAAQADISRIDRVEVIKGPSSALYGRSGPGGLVVQNSKLPLDRDLYGAISGTYGSYDLYRADADLGGRFSDTALWRIYGSVNGGHDQQQYGTRARQTISAATTLGAGTATTLTLLANYSHDPRNGNYGVFPAVGTLFSNPAAGGKGISTNFYNGEPNDFFKRDQLSATALFKHDFGANWSFKASGRYQYVKSRLGIVYISGAAIDPTVAPSTVYSRGSYSTDESNNDWVYDTQLAGKFTTGPFEHDVLIGADRQVLHFDENAAFGTATSIDAYNPVYGTMPTPQTPDEVPGGFPSRTVTHQRQQGVSVQDQISWQGLRLTLSGRQDWARQDVNGTGAQNDQKFTYRVGALYKTALGIAPYVTYSTSFQPQAATLTDGSLAKPSLGRQIEGGVKYQVPGTDILLTGAYFDIEQTNVLTYDPVSFLAYQSGKVRSRGVEIEAKAPLPHGFSVDVAFSRQGVRILEDQDPQNVGHGPPTVGRGGTSAVLNWAPVAGPLKGLTLGGAVRHVDQVYAYGDNNSPSYTLVDALMRFDLGSFKDRFKGMTVAVNATNLFDKRYLTGCYVNYNWCWYGNRRTVQGTVSYKF
ncbi:TonB-dependent siderophore receptor [Glacieibacterium megasporae]|uniref:TonB-dependent siderophore receptor n=1 Tax=Glacieibacterium megasporae TaxID=2835787 RepID=UPI002103ECED|nr:TonB-dependent siderophore receptor [Polymorphobacter megasporae]